MCLVRHTAQGNPQIISQLISHLNPVLSSLYYPQRIMATAFFGEVLHTLLDRTLCTWTSVNVCVQILYVTVIISLIAVIGSYELCRCLKNLDRFGF